MLVGLLLGDTAVTEDQAQIVAGAKLIVALSELTEVERHCVVGRHYRGLSRAQIADERGVTKDAIDVSLRRGMARLRSMLDPADFGIAA